MKMSVNHNNSVLIRARIIERKPEAGVPGDSRKSDLRRVSTNVVKRAGR